MFQNYQEEPSLVPLPCERFFVGFLIPSRFGSMILSPVRGHLNFPALRFFSIFV